jgi:hypothetical protein
MPFDQSTGLRKKTEAECCCGKSLRTRCCHVFNGCLVPSRDRTHVPLGGNI